MSERINKPRGTSDYLYKDADLFSGVVDFLFKNASSYGINRIEVPMYEEKRLFERTSGEDSDIVHKEMFELVNRGDHDYVLRPEFTASINRSVIENKLYASPDMPLKFSYCGSVFRYGRPQKGRLREFHQFGCEYLDPKLDIYSIVECIEFLYKSLTSLLNKKLVLQINYLGGGESRANYTLALKKYYADKIFSMCEDCQRRYETNILRILDCKVSHDKEINASAPSILDYLTLADADLFKKILSYLNALEVPYTIVPSIVRGLDYYSGIVFEIYDPDNLSLGAIGAGGEYDHLAEEIGGQPLKGIGFSIGLERVLLDLSEERKAQLIAEFERKTDIAIYDERKDGTGLTIGSYFRKKGYHVRMLSLNKSISSAVKEADRLACSYFLIVKDSMLSLKNMETREQIDYTIEDLEEIAKYLYRN